VVLGDVVLALGMRPLTGSWLGTGGGGRLSWPVTDSNGDDPAPLERRGALRRRRVQRCADLPANPSAGYASQFSPCVEYRALVTSLGATDHSDT